MILIDRGASDLVSGFDRISQADSVLYRRWRQPLLVAYARRREIYQSELEEYRRKRADFMVRLRIGILLSSVLLILGAVALPALLLLGELGSLRGPLLCFAPLLILAGLNGWAILGMLWMWQKGKKKKPQPPPNPLDRRIDGELITAWKEGLRGELPIVRREEDPSGIYHFIARLQALQAASLLIYRLKINQDEEIDVLMVGPSGIWAFEVINLNGVICWNEGVWSKSRGVHRLQQDNQAEIARGDQSFESIWSTKTDRLTQLVESEVADIAAGTSKAARVRGGLVFTHPQARFVIPPGVPFNWGVPRFWAEQLQKSPAIPGLDERTMIRILEVLLKRHQELSPCQLKSMDQYAERLIRQSEEQIEAWIAEV